MKTIEDKVKGAIPEVIKRRYREFIQPWKRKKEEKHYKGDNVICPICESHYRMFAPYGSKQRENAKCINCGSLERHRLLWKYLVRKVNIFKMGKIKLLHFAPEKIFYDIFSNHINIEYFPCDLFPEIYNYKGKTKIIKADITDIPFNNNHFDAILCNHVLEHIPDDFKAMSELHRVMKTDGWGIFQAPIDYKLEKTYEDFSITTTEGRAKAFGQYDHVRLYGKDYKSRLEKVGLFVIEDNFINDLSSEEIFRYGLMPSELIYYCTKHTAKFE